MNAGRNAGKSSMSIRSAVLLSVVSVAGTAILTAASAAAQSGPRSGRLTCQVGGALALVVTSRRAMDCRFVPRRGPSQRYLGTVRSFGIDLGTIRASTMSWRVYGPYARAEARALAGRYVGVAAGGAVGAGATGQALIGGPANGVRLQPLALQGASGFNVALGVSSLELVPAAARRR